MENLKHIAEVRNDYREEETGKYLIDVYLTDDDDESGFVAAEVGPDCNVEWRPNVFPSLFGVYDMTPIEEAIEEAKQKQIRIKQELVDKCIEALVHDVKGGDLTAIDELLFHVPTKNLQAFLPEEEK